MKNDNNKKRYHVLVISCFSKDSHIPQLVLIVLFRLPLGGRRGSGSLSVTGCRLNTVQLKNKDYHGNLQSKNEPLESTRVREEGFTQLNYIVDLHNSDPVT